jgi:hypothetical protein
LHGLPRLGAHTKVDEVAFENVEALTSPSSAHGRAGIEGLRIRDLRHSFASELVSSGASLALVGALLGHSVTTAHLYNDPMRKARGHGRSRDRCCWKAGRAGQAVRGRRPRAV